MTVRPGLCSVTYRQLPAEEVIRLAAEAGLRSVEWGGDRHAPPGDADRLVRLREATADSGLAVASYGSYFRAGRHGADEFGPVLAAAVALRAPRIRIWAGDLGTAEASADQVGAVVAATRAAARMAAGEGVELGFEFHRDTLTDSVESTLRLLDAVGEPNVTTYWQPRVDEPADDAVAGLARLADRVCALHVFSWWPGTTRLPLAERHELWQRAFATVGDRPTDALLEFVPGDEPDLLRTETRTLTTLLDGG